MLKIIIEPALNNLEVAISISNTGGSALSFLYWNTPFDPTCPNGLLVTTRDGTRAEYRGPRAKYRFDPDVSLIEIGPGETVVSLVNVSENYTVESEDEYSVSIIPDCIRGFENNSPPPSGLTCNYTILPLSQTRLSLLLFPTKFAELFPLAADFKSAVPPHCSTPLCMNSYFEEPVICVMGKSVYAHAKVERATVSQKSIIEVAETNLFHATAYPRPKWDVRDDANYRKWFGNFTDAGAKQVSKVLWSISGQAMCKNFVIYALMGCRPDVYASFVKSGAADRLDLMSVCNLFFNSVEHGRDSRAGTIAHELSHGYGDTFDFEYGEYCCLRLAQSRPDLATRNADSYQYYIEDVFSL